ncbi:hypothetical protein PAPYR_555 [Paratrimastix pyriformis]|uniref:Uncharacterized protein n=1 Tax=Paratrimastix pyriformis TaxID=342808 RepID=A0ABQ8UVT4_9EUKA|nr:hypothetical protein PAPYR_555 [Paratrimastix pyriformis]
MHLQHLCVLCCCGVETGKCAEHLASAGHAAQRALACLPPVSPQPPTSSPGDQKQGIQCVATKSSHSGVPATTAPLKAPTPPPWEMTSGDLWFRLPPELRRAIVEASSCPLHVYIQLLGLSHAIRQSIRGTLHELSFPQPDPALADVTPTITTDALAALVGPCKSLRKLALPEELDGLRRGQTWRLGG